jgi:myo-inositol-1(or 4)-monophosphatase
VDITVHFAARAIEAVRSVAAEEILPRYRSVVATRKDDGSVVTEADYAAQRALVWRLQKLESIPVLAEEMPSHEQVAIWERGGRFWCVDPLDGTSNFSSGIPYFAISVALMEGARPVFGTVYDPIADEAYYAVRGAGAWLNQRELRVPATGPRLSEAIAEVSLRREQATLRGALKRHPPCAKRLTSGSSALSWCHLAAARTDVMLHSGQKMWDYAGGALILEEAGGYACALESGDFWSGSVWSRSALAARTQPLLEEWRDWVRAHLTPPPP